MSQNELSQLLAIEEPTTAHPSRIDVKIRKPSEGAPGLQALPRVCYTSICCSGCFSSLSSMTCTTNPDEQPQDVDSFVDFGATPGQRDVKLEAMVSRVVDHFSKL